MQFYRKTEIIVSHIMSDILNDVSCCLFSMVGRNLISLKIRPEVDLVYLSKLPTKPLNSKILGPQDKQ